VEALNRIALYLQAAAALRSPNWTGLPLAPKSLGNGIPFSRSAYNSFIIWIKQLALPSARVAIDVGANHGDFASAATTCFPEANIILVEPLPKMQLWLEHTIRQRRPKWRLLPCALGSKRGRLPLFVDERDDNIGSLTGFSHEYLKINPQARLSKEVLCAVRTLDDVAEEMELSHVDLLKIDVEGFEFEVMKGAGQTLGKTTAVIVEVSLVRRPRASAALVEMLDLLTKHGFQIVNVIPSLPDPDEPWRPREFNVLARRGVT
jgi:FkbM family methyltransferase